jgi:hypothetical protein
VKGTGFEWECWVAGRGQELLDGRVGSEVRRYATASAQGMLSRSTSPIPRRSGAGRAVPRPRHATATAAQVRASGRYRARSRCQACRLAATSIVAHSTTAAPAHSSHADSLRVERLQQQLAELRQALLDARQREELAPAVFAAAELELRTAERQLPAAAEGDRGKLLSSLKRLRRHLDGTARRRDRQGEPPGRLSGGAVQAAIRQGGCQRAL